MNPFAPAAPAFDEPLEMLAACHERIEAQLTTLEKLVEHVAAARPDAPAREAAARVMRYFDTAGRHHHRDEDEDVFPLLRRLAADRDRPEVSAVINGLEQDHATMEAQWSRLRERLESIAKGGVGGESAGAREAGAEAVGEARLGAEEVARFAWLYRRHMEKESALVLPFAREALSEAERAELGSRMAARRRIGA